MVPLYHGEGFKRKLIGWVRRADRALFTPSMQVSEPVRQPREFSPYVPVNRQIFVNKAHHRRVHAIPEALDGSEG